MEKEVIEQKEFDWMMNPKGKICRNCQCSGYSKGDLVVTCGHHLQNFSSNSGCASWISPNDPDYLEYTEKRKKALRAKLKLTPIKSTINN